MFIPEGVESIEDCAFAFCSNLTSVRFPATLKSIGKQAFLSCRRLSECELPDSVTLGVGAFADTPFMKDKQMLIIDGVLYDCDTEVTSVTIPDTVTEISDNAFNGCRFLTEITIPEGVKSVGANAFLACSSLKRVNLPDSLSYMGEYCFAHCSSMESITIPDGIEKIKTGTFEYCTSLSEVILPDTVTEIGGVAFGQTSIQTIDLPAGLTKLGSAAFNGSSLVSVQIPEGVTACNNLFLQCYFLKTVEFLGELESIEAHCFANCNSLESVTMKGVKECFPKAFLYSIETARIYCGSDVYYSPDSFIKAVSSNPGNGYTRGDMVDVGGIMLTPKAYEEAVSFNDNLNATVEDYIRNFDIDETEIQQLKLSRIFRKLSCDYGYGTMSGSANGALLYGVAVCEGMAECMKVLCELADIECVVIREVPLDHAWVKVKVDGE